MLLGLCAVLSLHFVFDDGFSTGLSHYLTTDERRLQSSAPKGLDFMVAGFPKCGTTSMRVLLQNHEETNVLHKYQVNNIGKEQEVEYFLQSGNKLYVDELFEDLKENSEEGMKNGIKWPDAVIGNNIKSIGELHKYNPKGHLTSVIVGVRHPVKWFESFYNYRVMATTSQMKRIGRDEDIQFPDPYSLIGGENKSWLHVYTDLARWERSLMQLGKWTLSKNDMKLLEFQKHMIISTPNKFFIYDVDQLADPDEDTNESFRKDLSDFLGLKRTFDPIPHSNDQNKLGKKEGQIDICDSEYDSLRLHLVKQGRESADWMIANAANGLDIVLGGDDHFFTFVQKWAEDPCDETDVE